MAGRAFGGKDLPTAKPARGARSGDLILAHDCGFVTPGGANVAQDGRDLRTGQLTLPARHHPTVATATDLHRAGTTVKNGSNQRLGIVGNDIGVTRQRWKRASAETRCLMTGGALCEVDHLAVRAGGTRAITTVCVYCRSCNERAAKQELKSQEAFHQTLVSLFGTRRSVVDSAQVNGG